MGNVDIEVKLQLVISVQVVVFEELVAEPALGGAVLEGFHQRPHGVIPNTNDGTECSANGNGGDW